MHFLTVRDLRINTARVWKDLADVNELIVTLNGRPVALLTGITEDTLEDTLASVRESRAVVAIRRLRRHAASRKLDNLTPRDIEREIKSVRRRKSLHRITAKA